MTDLDVLVIGAGISGIDAAAHLLRERPHATVAVIEAREDLGGTWDLFRYPGIRSDSDMFTFGFGWRPWRSASILASGDRIRDYLHEVAAESGVEDVIRFGHTMIGADWDSTTQRWTVTVAADDGIDVITTRFLWSCTGYYDYAAGYQPAFPGRGDFEGDFVHPQHWPAELDYTGKSVVVIGSGATAVTLLPSMVEGGAEHVTMLQRTPTYIVSRAANNTLYRRFEALPVIHRLPLRGTRQVVVDKLVRWENLAVTLGWYALCRTAPDKVRAIIRAKQLAELQQQPGFSREEAETFVDAHLTPPYSPWDQRMCFVPDGDFWQVIREGKATIATDKIARITATGIELESGEEIQADVIVSATGLNLQMFGGAPLTVDGASVVARDTTVYGGAMLSSIPNFAFTAGYTNASWTLKADLVSAWVTGLLKDMDAHGHTVVRAAEPESNTGRPLMDLTSGYLQRGQHLMPRQGTGPYQLRHNYYLDTVRMKPGRYHADGILTFT